MAFKNKIVLTLGKSFYKKVKTDLCVVHNDNETYGNVLDIMGSHSNFTYFCMSAKKVHLQTTIYNIIVFCGSLLLIGLKNFSLE